MEDFSDIEKRIMGRYYLHVMLNLMMKEENVNLVEYDEEEQDYYG